VNNQIIIFAIISLGGIGLAAAVILFFVAQKFKVIEDPKIDLVQEVLPAANCGGCGFAGCRNFAEAMVKAGTMEGFNCPVGGNQVMSEVGKILGLEVSLQDPLIAVIRCNGSKEHAPHKTEYDGAKSCFVANALFSGESGCAYGCLGLGDCVSACIFDAIEMDNETGLPVVNDKCTACGACVKACPRHIIELRKRGPKGKRIFVSCINEEKGAVAKKNCDVACIGCSKCFKVCTYDAIVMNNNLAFIDYQKCKLCRKCEPECPTKSIWEVNFPVRKEKNIDAKEASVNKEVESDVSANNVADKTM
jgi:Na+-translocating ferredoxin:NAD+ oxidoreductase RNF subunit RnfB